MTLMIYYFDINEYKSFYGDNFNGEEMLSLADFVIADTSNRKKHIGP